MRRQRNMEAVDLDERVVAINPVSKTVKGGRNRRFNALVVVGDGKGRVGAAMGKAKRSRWPSGKVPRKQGRI